MEGEVGAAAEEDVEEEICSWKASRSLRRAFDCFRAWLYSEFIVAGERRLTRTRQRRRWRSTVRLLRTGWLTKRQSLTIVSH